MFCKEDEEETQGGQEEKETETKVTTGRKKE